MVKSTNTILLWMLLPSNPPVLAQLLKGTKSSSTSYAHDGEPIATETDPSAARGQRKTRLFESEPATATGVHSEPSPELLCSAFMIYDSITRRLERNRPIDDGGRNPSNSIDWSSACPPLHDLNPQLCPSGPHLENICTQPYGVDLTASVTYGYCQPLMEEIEDEENFLDCVRACTIYVSKDRGDCCQFQCS
mmetsp:Transcript_10352/g.22412  ORF Transcript_10352/g.22412 Transcript_10352/m.22412 type:complete len:192 (-) Transcript_10352:482-1057(-)